MDGHCQFNKRINHTYDIFRYVLYTSDNTWFYNFIYGYVGLFDIYNKQVRRTIMAKETMREMLKMIDAKVSHLEDIQADNREFIIKLVKQTNQIVKFLSKIDIETVDEEMDFPTLSADASFDIERSERLKNLLDEFMDKKENLKEFEEELKKHKDKLTPGQVGEA